MFDILIFVCFPKRLRNIVLCLHASFHLPRCILHLSSPQHKVLSDKRLCWQCSRRPSLIIVQYFLYQHLLNRIIDLVQILQELSLSVLLKVVYMVPVRCISLSKELNLEPKTRYQKIRRNNAQSLNFKLSFMKLQYLELLQSYINHAPSIYKCYG